MKGENMTKAPKYTEKKAIEDAEDVLINIMQRRNFGSRVRDDLAKCLVRIVRRQSDSA